MEGGGGGSEAVAGGGGLGEEVIASAAGLTGESSVTVWFAAVAAASNLALCALALSIFFN